MSIYFSSECGVDGGYVNMSNSNAYMVMQAVGLGDECCGEMKVEVFLNLCQNWLRRNINKLSKEILTVQDGNFINCGVDEGYVNNRVHQLVLLAQKAKSNGAKMIFWS